MTIYGRHGEAPLPVIAARAPSDAFETAIEAARIALKYMTPVILLSDGYIGTSAEPWRLPDIDDLPDISVPYATGANGEDGSFLPYLRDETTLARPWAVPGTTGLEHRVGGLEKDYLTGNVSYNPQNHERMTLVRENKIKGIAADIPPLEVEEPDADVLVLGWGSSYGAITAGVRRVRARGEKVAQAHLRHVHPFPANLAEVLGSYDKILIPELNRGQLWRLIRAEFLVDAISYPKVQGQPFKAVEIETKIMEVLGS
jgi:2-oxoglutarate ferredoxin oxidoreductase subunit alpha